MINKHLLCAIAALAACCSASIATDSSKVVLEFPDKVVGVIYAYAEGKAPKRLAAARGRVAIPKDQKVTLKIRVAATASEDNLDFLKKLPSKNVLCFDCSRYPFEDKHCSLISHLIKIKRLSCNDTEIGDAGLRVLRTMQEVETIDVSRTLISARGCGILADQFPHLKNLSCGWTQISDAGLCNLARMKDLQFLLLASTGISDAGVTRLTGLSKLTYLNLAYNRKVTDRSIPDLLRIKSLVALDITDTVITPTGCEKLKALPNLNSLCVHFSPTQIAVLKRKLTGVTIADVRRTDRVPLEVLEPLHPAF